MKIYHIVGIGLALLISSNIGFGAAQNVRTKEEQQKLDTALYDAVRYGEKADEVKQLLDRGANPNTQTKFGETPLISSRSFEITKLLLDHSANPNAQDASGRTPLYHAVNAADQDQGIPIIKLLLERKADPNIKDRRGKTPLMETRWHKKRDMILALLLAHGADPNVRLDDPDESTLLHFAETVEQATLLLAHGANPNARNKYDITPLHKAVENKRTAIVQLLLDHNADPNIKSYDNKTPLHYVEDNTAIARLLLDKGANPNAQDKDGETPLMQVKSVEMAQLLLDKGADPNIQDKHGFTSLHYAVGNLQTGIVTLLLDYKADPTIKSKDGATAFDVATKTGKFPLILPFILSSIKAGDKVDIEQPNDHGETLLMQAIAHKVPLNQLQALIASGANPYRKDSEGHDAFDYSDGSPAVLKILRTTKHTPAEGQSVAQLKNPKLQREGNDTLYRSLSRALSPEEQAHVLSQSYPDTAEDHTASEIYAEIFRQEILKKYGQEINAKKIDILTLLARERIYFDTHYVFYHGQNSAHRVAQDFLLAILSLLGIDYPPDFIPMRFLEGKAVLTNSDPKTFLNAKQMVLSSNFRNNDQNPAIGQHLLAVNIALFGNIDTEGESSFDYYLQNRSIKPMDVQNLLEEIVTFFNFKADLVYKLASSQSPITRGLGSLLQIFIPKGLVDHCVYLTVPGGFPYYHNLGIGGYEIIDEKMKLGYQVKISPVLEAIESGTLPKGELTKDVLARLQARIIIGKDIMLNPKSGVKIFREVNLPQVKLGIYQLAIHKIAVQVMIDWLERLISGKIPKEVIARLEGTPLAEIIKDKERAGNLLSNLRSIAREILPPPVKPAIPSKL